MEKPVYSKRKQISSLQFSTVICSLYVSIAHIIQVLGYVSYSYNISMRLRIEMLNKSKKGALL